MTNLSSNHHLETSFEAVENLPTSVIELEDDENLEPHPPQDIPTPEPFTPSPTQIDRPPSDRPIPRPPRRPRSSFDPSSQLNRNPDLNLDRNPDLDSEISPDMNHEIQFTSAQPLRLPPNAPSPDRPIPRPPRRLD